MLSPTADQRTLAPTRAKERGKHKVSTEESITFELLSLLKYMKEELRERDEQMIEELRWRNNHLEDQIKERNNTLAVALQ